MKISPQERFPKEFRVFFGKHYQRFGLGWEFNIEMDFTKITNECGVCIQLLLS
jgi:hypothetical protein